MKKKAIYNDLKLSEYRALFHAKRVLVVGAGAVGSFLMEFLARMGVSPDVIDFDHFTLENAAKHSCLVRCPEDADRNKAECVSARVQPLLDEGCTSNGIDGNLCNLGPEAFSDYDAVFFVVDNYDAKILGNELIRSLPEERRPVMVMAGTKGEAAQSTIIDGSDFCLHCLIADHWIPDSSIRTSCIGVQTRVRDGVTEIVRTTDRASSMAAYLATEQFRGFVIGMPGIMNRRLNYTSFPNIEISSSYPMKKKNCPGCEVEPPEKIEWLHGTVLEVTLAEALKQIAEKSGNDDFELAVHELNFRRESYSDFVTTAGCSYCGKTLKIMRHNGFLFPEDLICETCKAEHRTGHVNAPAETIQAFSKHTDSEIQDKTLYQLGFPLGAHLEVSQRSKGLDILDQNITKMIFSFDQDHAQMHKIHKL